MVVDCVVFVVSWVRVEVSHSLALLVLIEVFVSEVTLVILAFLSEEEGVCVLQQLTQLILVLAQERVIVLNRVQQKNYRT